MTSSERVAKYHERQRKAGRKLVTIYLHPETIAALCRLSSGRARGEIVERAVAELWRAHSNGSGVT